MVMHVIADQTVTAFASMEKSHFWKLWGVFLDTEVETRRRSQHPVIRSLCADHHQALFGPLTLQSALWEQQGH